MNKLFTFIYRDKTIKSIDKKIRLLGINAKYNAISFMNFRVLSSIILFFVVLYLIDFGYIVALIIVYLYYIFILIQKSREEVEN